MATVLTNGGKGMVTALLSALGSATPAYAGWGTGAGTAAITDTTLFTESADEARAATTLTQQTTTTTEAGTGLQLLERINGIRPQNYHSQLPILKVKKSKARIQATYIGNSLLCLRKQYASVLLSSISPTLDTTKCRGQPLRMPMCGKRKPVSQDLNLNWERKLTEETQQWIGNWLKKRPKMD